MESRVRVWFEVPPTSLEPIELGVAHSPLRMVLVDRGAVYRLDDSWKRLGVYFLVGPPKDDAYDYRVYVGEVGKRTLSMRVKEHVAEKDWWQRALLVTSDSVDFHSAAIGWLEGRLYDAINNATAAEVDNHGKPGDNSLPVSEQGSLEHHVVHPIMAALRACGVSLDTADQQPPPAGEKRKYYSETLQDLIAGDVLKSGTVLQPSRKAFTQTARVLEDGRLEVAGEAHNSVSAAAKAVSGAKAEAGWEFWLAPSGGGGYVSLFELRDKLREHTEEASTPAVPPVHPAEKPPQPPDGPQASESPSRAGGPPPEAKLGFAELIQAGELHVGSRIVAQRRRKGSPPEIWEAELQADGRLILAGETEPHTPGRLADAVTGTSVNAWTFWKVIEQGERVPLATVRERVRNRLAAPEDDPPSGS